MLPGGLLKGFICSLANVSFVQGFLSFLFVWVHGCVRGFSGGEGSGISFLGVGCVVRPIPQRPGSTGLSHNEVKQAVVVL